MPTSEPPWSSLNLTHPLQDLTYFWASRVASGATEVDPLRVMVGLALAALAESLDALDKGRSPLDRAKFGAAPGDRVTVKALPYNIFDHLLLSGFRADVWLQPGVTATQAADLAADPDAPASVLVTHHVEEIPEGFSHCLLLAEGQVVAAGLLTEVLTSENLSQAFGQSIALDYIDGRYFARRTRSRAAHRRRL